MAYKFNIFTGNLDIVTNPSAGSGNVTGESPTTIDAIARWDDTTGTTIKDSKTLVQDSGAIEAQGFITRTIVNDDVVVHGDEAWIAPSLQLDVGGSITLEADSELIIV